MRVHTMARAVAGRPHAPARWPFDDGVASNIDQTLEIEHAQTKRPSLRDHLADGITAFSGSMVFVWIHAIWFVLWISVNTFVPGWQFDGFPFGFLTMVVSLEAIFLSTFVLISQNRQAYVAERRSQLDLQINLLSEQEVTKLMSMVSELHEHAGLNTSADPEVKEMAAPTDVRHLASELDRAVENGAHPGES